MNFKVFAVVFIGLLSVNLSVQSPTLKDDSIKTIVVQVLERILSVSTELLNNATAVVDELERDRDAITERVIAWAVNVGIDLNSLILRGVDELRDGATDDGKAVIDCIDAGQEKAEANIDKVFREVGTCVAAEGPLVIAEIRTILAQLTDLRDDVAGQTTTLGGCTDDDETCLVDFLLTIASTAQKIPPAVVDDVNAVIALVRTIVADVRVCTADTGKEIRDNFQELFNEAVVCFKN